MLNPDIYYLDLASTAIFAFSGAVIARRKSENLTVICFYGLVTAMGGGTLRQWILQADSVFWMEDYLYLLACGLGVAASHHFGAKYSIDNVSFRITESYCMAVFVSVGFAAATSVTDSLSLAVALGILTGIGGGLIRDTLLASTPRIFSDPLLPLLLLASLGGIYGAETTSWWISWVGTCIAIAVIEINRSSFIDAITSRIFKKNRIRSN